MAKMKPWYNFFKKPYQGHDPYFFEREQLDWISVVEANFPVIKKEMLQIIDEGELTLKPYRFHESSDGKVEWQTVAFVSWGYRFHKNCLHCPESMKVFDSIPGLVSVSLSRLEANATIPVHRGDTNAIIRSHLGLMVPGSLPDCGFQTGDEQRSWEEGQVLPFCDAQPHSAWNKTDTERLVLIIDVMREEYKHLKKKVCAIIITSHMMLMLDQKIKFHQLASPLFLRSITVLVAFFVRLVLPVRNKLTLWLP